MRSFGLRPQDDIKSPFNLSRVTLSPLNCHPGLPHRHTELLNCHPERSEGSQPARPRPERTPGIFNGGPALRMRSFGLRPQDDIKSPFNLSRVTLSPLNCHPGLPHCHPELLNCHPELSEGSQPARFRSKGTPGIFNGGPA